MQERCFRALSRAAMEMNACSSWCHMPEEGGDARGMPAFGENLCWLWAATIGTCRVFIRIHRGKILLPNDHNHVFHINDMIVKTSP